jgi:hypothetical protein
MTSRAALPTDAEVQEAIIALTEETGKPSTLAVATKLGIANTTFRRQFPSITADLGRNRRSDGTLEDDQPSSPFHELKKQNTQLRREIENLKANLELAVANIQRLTLDKHRLQQERDEAARVTPISRARQRPP